MQIEPNSLIERKVRADKGNGCYQEKRRGSHDKVRDERQRNKPFVAYDGEGFTTQDGTHHYALFGNSLGARIRGSDVSWRSCFQMLFNAPKEAHHVIFAGSYDIVMMFRNEPIEQVKRLMQSKPCTFDQYRVTFMRGKMLRITDKERKETRTLFDVFSFFGKSFVKACEEYLGESELLTEIHAMKLKRDTFTAAQFVDGTVASYMGQELKLLVELCHSLRERLALVNIHPQSWHGPGAVASTVLRTHKVKDHMGTYDDTVRLTAESAYYGGRFEQFQRGTFNQPCYQYDIRSAYPAVMAQLPSFDGAWWITRKGAPHRIEPYSLYYVDWQDDSADPFSIGWLPHRRSDGSIYFPPNFAKGWYWGIEIPPHMRGSITEQMVTKLASDVKPFAFVEEMYEQRAILKRANQPHQLALKLALNSLYGKLAQSKGARLNDDGTYKRPTFHQIMWAGLITAATRRMLNDAMHAKGLEGKIIATETDSIFSTVPLDLPISEALGQWDKEVLEGITYVASGVSLIKRDGVWSFKTRGFSITRNASEVELWRDFLSAKGKTMALAQVRFGTDPRRQDFATWYRLSYQLSLDGLNSKRRHNEQFCEHCRYEDGYNNSLHPLYCPPIPITETTPYRFTWNDILEGPATLEDMIRLDDENSDILLRLEYT